MTLRNDECGCVAKSTDGLHYTDLHHWCWDDGSLLDNYNTQQHWMTVGDELYLVYTRRGADNDHVFRHRAPLFAAKVEHMRLRRDTEAVLVGQRGARLGNFGVTSCPDGKAAVMAAESSSWSMWVSVVRLLWNIPFMMPLQQASIKWYLLPARNLRQNLKK